MEQIKVSHVIFATQIFAHNTVKVHVNDLASAYDGALPKTISKQFLITNIGPEKLSEIRNNCFLDENNFSVWFRF